MKTKSHSASCIQHSASAFMAACTLLAAASAQAGWQLVWNDEFNQADGSAPSSTNWNFDIGTGVNGWGNGESQYYTDRTNNARVEGGLLVIEALEESLYVTNDYTSARLLTKGKWDWTYGRINGTGPMAGWKRESKCLAGRASGRRSGCWGTTLIRWVGPNAVRSTSWRTSAAKPTPSTAQCMARATRAATASARRIRCRAVRPLPMISLPMISTSLPWNGRPTRSGGMWTISTTSPSPPRTSEATPGCSIIPTSSS